MAKMSKKTKRKGIKKRASVEVQFNWIFVLFAGAMILMFFILIITKQKSISEKKLAIDILNSMDEIMSGQKVSENRQDVIDMFETSFVYSCGGCDCAFSLAGMSKGKGNTVVFAPSAMSSTDLIVWTQRWDMPFRVTNFVYMTVPEIRYYFITSDPPPAQIDSFIKSFPENITYDIVGDVGAIKDKGEEKIRLVFFSSGDAMPSMPGSLSGADDYRVSAVTIDASGPSWYKGNAMMKFYKKQGNSFVADKGEDFDTNGYPVLGIPSAYGAVYTDSYQIYRCNMNDAVKRMGFVARIYQTKASMLSQNAINGDISAACGAFYLPGYFNDMIGLEPGNAAAFYSSIDTLTTFNDYAISASCPRIY